MAYIHFFQTTINIRVQKFYNLKPSNSLYLDYDFNIPFTIVFKRYLIIKNLINYISIEEFDKNIGIFHRNIRYQTDLKWNLIWYLLPLKFSIRHIIFLSNIIVLAFWKLSLLSQKFIFLAWEATWFFYFYA